MKRVAGGAAQTSSVRKVPNAAYVLELAVVAVAYLSLAELERLLPSLNPVATPCWPPTGVTLAFVLLCGYRIWPAILLGSFAVGVLALFASNPMSANVLLAPGACGIGAVLAAFAGAWLMDRHAGGRLAFLTVADTAKFALITFVPVALISSAVATGSLMLANGATTPDYATWIAWWLADAAGTLLVAPAIVLWAATPLRPSSKRSPLEAAAIFILAGGAAVVAFNPMVGALLDGLAPYQNLLGFLAMVPLLWAALKGNRRVGVTAALIFCAVASVEIFAGGDASAQSDSVRSLLLLLALAVCMPLAALIVSAITASGLDREAHLLSEHTKLDHQLAETHLALESSRRLFQILIEGIVDYAVFVIDTGGHIASWNGAAQRVTGFTADEIVGKHFGIFYRPDERRAGEPNRGLEMAARHGRHEVEGWRIKKNGALLFVTGSITAMRDNEGNLVGFANILRDATERRAAHEKLVETREQLAMAQKMEAIGKLTGGIAHDFNNLLMIIGGNAQMFKRLLDPKLPRAIEAIQTAARRGESLTRQLLTFARRQHLTPTVVDLNDCIKDMRTMIESSLRGNIVYTEKISDDVRLVKVDLAELELAIVNIAVNARDAMPHGGTFCLSIGNVTGNQNGHRSDKDYVALEFSDTGTGIPPDLLSKIFDPFFTTKEVGKGTGLGLSQVYGFAHQSGGMVMADSHVGQGTTLTIYLPALAEHEIADSAAVPDEPALERPAVLIVDDSAEVAEVTSSLFEDLGYATVYRESADAALRLLADGTRVDLVFSDIVMPGAIDGVGLAKEIRSQYPHLPVILTTGYSDAARAAPVGMRILRKPFDSQALKGFIQEAMDVRTH